MVGDFPPDYVADYDCKGVSQTCDLNCGPKVYSLATVVTSGVQKLFLTSATFNNFKYGFVVPLCSSRPTDDSLFPPTTWTGNNWIRTPSFSQSTDLWQFVGNGDVIFLGQADLNSWSIGTFATSTTVGTAFSLTYQNGDFCDVVGDYRISTVYFACDSTVASSDVRVEVTESPTCVCKSLFFLSFFHY